MKLGAGPGKVGEMDFEAAEREKRRDGPAGRGNWPWAGLGRELGFRMEWAERDEREGWADLG